MIEPDPFAYERWLFNLNSNGILGVQTLHGALGLELGTLPLESSRGLGKSFSRINFDSESESSGKERKKVCRVPVFDFDTIQRIFSIDRLDAVKMDIEGGEFQVFPELVPKLQKFKPKFLLSLHGPNLTRSEFDQKFPALKASSTIVYQITSKQVSTQKLKKHKIIPASESSQ